LFHSLTPVTSNDKHFATDGATILPLTSEARVTVKLLDLDMVERVKEREIMLQAGLMF